MAPPAHDEALIDASGHVGAGWRTAFAALVALAVSPSVLQVMSLGVFAPHLRAEFGWGLAQVSVGATILAVLVTIVSPVQGLLVDRYGARRLILTSIPLFGLGYAALSLMTRDIWSFYLLWGLLPVLGIGLWPASYVKATSGWFDRRLGLAIAVATMGIGIGAALLPMVIERLTGAHGWRTAFAAIGIGSVVLAWPLAWGFIRDREGSAAGLTRARDTHVFDAASKRTFAILVAAFVLLGIYSTSILFHLVGILTGAGLERPVAVGAQAVLGLAMIAGRLGSGAVVDHVSVRVVMPVVVAGSCAALIMLIGGVTPGSVLIVAALLGLLIGAEIDVLGYVVKRYFGLARYGAIYGVLFGTFQFGGAGGVYLLAHLREASGDYGSGLLALLAALVAAGILFAVLGPYRYGRVAKPADGVPVPAPAADPAPALVAAA